MTRGPLDPSQIAAVNAEGGVIQVLAPAGSGKTTVLVERVAELRRRRVVPDRIWCLTFNRAAAEELRGRFSASQLGPVRATTFHGLGWRILKSRSSAMTPDPSGARRITTRQWQGIARGAKDDVGYDGLLLTRREIVREISAIKRGLLVLPAEYERQVERSGDSMQLTVARAYVRYQQTMRENGLARGRWLLDYDDLLLMAMRALAADERLRVGWQARCGHVLVDEYQDTDAAQERLLLTVSAPDNEIFCAADEDQTLYAFRGASVDRVMGMSSHFPSLQQFTLGYNHRCPPDVVEASARLIAHNKVRFPKEIRSGRGATAIGRGLALARVESGPPEAAETARSLLGRKRDEVVVLARTWNQLRPVALACAELGVAVDGHPRLFEPALARAAVLAHLRLASAPRKATAALVAKVCRNPPRGLPDDQAATVAAALRSGAAFTNVFAPVEVEAAQTASRLSPGALFQRLAETPEADRCIEILANEGGLGAWLEEVDASNRDEVEREMLEQCRLESVGLDLRGAVSALERYAERLRATRARGVGIELATIHQAKGREWLDVILIGCNEGRLPHENATQEGAEAERRGEGVEAERRLAYVAFTRARRRLTIGYAPDRPSRFLVEAGLLPPREEIVAQALQATDRYDQAA